MKIILKGYPRLTAVLLVSSIGKALESVGLVLLPTVIVKGIVQGIPLSKMVYQVLFLSIGTGIIHFIYHYLEESSFAYPVIIRGEFGTELFKVYLTMPYEKLLEVENREKFQEHFANTSGSNSSGAEAFFYQTNVFIQNFITLIVFGLTLSTFTPSIFVLVMMVGITSYFSMRAVFGKWKKLKEEGAPLDLRFDYLFSVAYGVEYGKDMRVYETTDWFDAALDENLQQKQQVVQKISTNEFKGSAGRLLGNFIQNIVAYSYLIKGVVAGTLSVSQFTLYISILSQFTGIVEELVSCVNLLQRASDSLSEARAWISQYEGEKQENTEQLPKKVDITFQDVSYVYPCSDTPVVEHLNFTLKAGEKVALVGRNGAGKTTVVKLLCGLLEPTTGKIIINQKDGSLYTKKERYQLIAPVFQESLVFAENVAHNISLTEEYEKERILDILEQVGLADKIKHLPNQEQTELTRYLHDEGVEFSGGQEQKLMVARALYKDSPVLVLDEPTAALDALAEAELYHQYNHMAHGKTSLFISHRLSSTRFCDRILFLSEGHITEEGTHQVLMDYQGDYAEMYEVQSHYYKETEGDSHGTMEIL